MKKEYPWGESNKHQIHKAVWEQTDIEEISNGILTLEDVKFKETYGFC